jgi:hypothetical protein
VADEKKSPTHRFGCEYFPEAAMEHARAAHHEMRKGVEALLPPEFVQHRRAARKEMLMAAREVINHALELIEERE